MHPSWLWLAPSKGAIFASRSENVRSGALLSRPVVPQLFLHGSSFSRYTKIGIWPFWEVLDSSRPERASCKGIFLIRYCFFDGSELEAHRTLSRIFSFKNRSVQIPEQFQIRICYQTPQYFLPRLTRHFQHIFCCFFKTEQIPLQFQIGRFSKNQENVQKTSQISVFSVEAHMTFSRVFPFFFLVGPDTTAIPDQNSASKTA